MNSPLWSMPFPIEIAEFEVVRLFRKHAFTHEGKKKNKTSELLNDSTNDVVLTEVVVLFIVG